MEVVQECSAELAHLQRPPHLTNADMTYSVITLTQGSAKWLAWRHEGIGASDAPVVMGENRWKSVDTLFREKCGNIPEDRPTAAMRRGNALEPEARDAYIRTTGNMMAATCLQGTRYPWQRASLDGLSADGKIAVEIKCGIGCYWKTKSSQAVPDYYVGQLQHILAITELEVIDFWCYLPDYPAIRLRVHRDSSYIKRLIAAERRFWERVEVNATSKRILASAKASKGPPDTRGFKIDDWVRHSTYGCGYIVGFEGGGAATIAKVHFGVIRRIPLDDLRPD